MKNTLKGINSSLDKAEDWTNNLEDKVAENTQSKQQKQEDGSEKSGRGVHFPLHMGKTPSWSTEEQSEQPTVPQCLWR